MVYEKNIYGDPLPPYIFFLRVFARAPVTKSELFYYSVDEKKVKLPSFFNTFSGNNGNEVKIFEILS